MLQENFSGLGYTKGSFRGIKMTKICIFGAGAIGGYLAHSLHKGGAEISLIARGSHLYKIKEKGLTLITEGKKNTIHFKATDTPEELGPQDYIICSLKAHSLAVVIDRFKSLIDSETAIVPAVNGIPWWYFHKANSGTKMENKWLQSVDPNGKIWKTLGPERAIGCVVYPACETVSPGTIIHKGGNRFSLGEPNGQKSKRVDRLSKLMRKGGLHAPIKSRIRDEIWIKLWGNCSFNPVSALTGASLDQIGNNAASRSIIRDAMLECKKVGEAVGAKFFIDLEARIDGATKLKGHKPSTRQDIELGRPMEIDALTSTVLELARKLKINTPILDTLATLLRVQGASLGLYQVDPKIEISILPTHREKT